MGKRSMEKATGKTREQRVAEAKARQARPQTLQEMTPEQLELYEQTRRKLRDEYAMRHGIVIRRQPRLPALIGV